MAELPNERLVCVICGRPAFGLNYGVPSCNACKMFYRRSDEELLRLVCVRGNRCYEEENLPMLDRHCKPCRYRKCMRVNMQRVPNNPDPPNVPRPPRAPNAQQAQIVPNAQQAQNVPNDQQAQIVPNDQQAQIVPNAPITQQPQNSPNENREVVMLAGIPKPFVTRDLIDSILLHELMLLNDARIEVYSSINICEDPTFDELVRQGSNLSKYKRPQPIRWEETVRKLKPWGSLGTLVVVEMIKTMHFYRELHYHDQINLLKGVAFKSHHLSIAFDNFMAKKSRVYTPTGEEMFPQVLLNDENWKEKINDLQEEPVKPLLQLKVNVNEYMLLNMIMICDPEIPNISPSGKETLYRWQCKYTNLLLQACLQSDSAKGPARLLALLGVLNQFRKQILRTRKMLKLLHSELKCYIPAILRESCNVEELI